MQKLLVILVLYCLYCKSFSLQIVWDNLADVNLNEVNSDDLFRSENPLRMPNWFFIFPGTKWCGAGNIAENDNDFGTERDTDKCCKNHDFCPEFINGYETKYNLTNPNFYTRLHCDCDTEFYRCLKTVSTKTSDQVGQIYFTALGTQCYKESFPSNGCTNYTVFPKMKCLEYSFDYSKEMAYQWFDLPNF